MPLLPRATAVLLAPALLVAPARAQDRTSLPLEPPVAPAITVLDVRDATPPPRTGPEAPEGAPNVVIVLLDDVGFGQPSAFGGPIPTPTLEGLALEGLRYTRFHTAGDSVPTRVALLTGRDAHVANLGADPALATSFPGYTGVRPPDVVPLPEILRLNGWSTAMFGLAPETPPWEASSAGPFDRWPTGSGFERFYGVLGDDADPWAPVLHDGTRVVDTPRDPAYHLTTDLTDHAIAWLKNQRRTSPDRPFFLYFAPPTGHAPQAVPDDWSGHFTGQFDDGWDLMRTRTLARQRRLGIVPPDTGLAPKPPEIPEWADLTDDEKALYARQMEITAGGLAMVDHELGRLVAALKQLRVLDDTLLIVIAGDEGATAEGGLQGRLNARTAVNGVDEPLDVQLRGMHLLGGPMAYSAPAAGWAVAGDAPFGWTGGTATYGGTANGLVVRWPAGIRRPGGLRTQWAHVLDVAPTVLEVAGLPTPERIDGLVQQPMEGTSLAYTFRDSRAPGRRITQIFEVGGNRGIYYDGWFATVVHAAPWDRVPRARLADDRWELYDTAHDFGLARDLAEDEPDRLAELQAVFQTEAERLHVLPLDDRREERLDPALAGRPDPMGRRTSVTLGPEVVGLPEAAFLPTADRDLTITARVVVPEGGADGPILVDGGRFAGWALHLDHGRPAFTHGGVGLERTLVVGPDPLPPGGQTLTWTFTSDGPGAGGEGRLQVNGRTVASATIERTASAPTGETVDVGADLGTPVSESYAKRPRFTGTVEDVTVQVGPRKEVQAAWRD